MYISKALSVAVIALALSIAPNADNHSAYAQSRTTAISIGAENAHSPKKQEGESKKVDINKYLPMSKYHITKKIVTKPKKEVVTTYWQVPLSNDLQDYIRKLCNEYGVSERLAYGVIETESNFDPYKVSNTNDYGLFQINSVNRPWLAEKFGVTDWFNPFQNAECGVYMLSQLCHKYTNYSTVLIAYNCGEGGMEQLESEGVYSTQYSQTVEKNMESLKTKDVITYV
ncbi:hypothetical protein QB910_000088 [Dabrowskivirus KKP3916]|uniref:Transglycosylase SLT domain-containing protein n=1 Tax=Alicyclobacillus phage KKP_3916 TaxID=3040651 RepID=A0AAT9V7M4_9CAUD|nr:hypothetical protein QB910_000088 [Alicyclobacillus phage KKP 3916]